MAELIASRGLRVLLVGVGAWLFVACSGAAQGQTADNDADERPPDCRYSNHAVKSQNLYIETQVGGTPGEVFGVRTWRGATLSDNGRLTKEFLAQIESWRNSAALSASVAPTEPNLGSAKFGAVTSLSPKVLARAAVLIRMLYLDCFVGAAIAALLGFRPGFMESEPTAANSNGWVFVYVILAMWLTHVVMLVPFWRYREPQQTSGGTRPAPVPAQSVF